MPVDYKGREHSNPVIRSFIASLVRLTYKGGESVGYNPTITAFSFYKLVIPNHL
jgi:hypothetical protein